MNLILSFIPALVFFLLPIFIGRAIYGLTSKDKSISYPYISYFVLGALVVFGLALILTKAFFISKFTTLIFIAVTISAVVNFILLILRKNWDFHPTSYIKRLIVSVFTAVLVYGIWQYHAPYPLNWDFLEHQTLVNNILNEKFSFVTSQISDTFGFNGYSSLFHLLLSIPQIFFSIDIVTFWLRISFVHLVLVILASYIFAYSITRDELTAFLSAFFGAFVFESVTFTSLFFIPQTFTAVLFIFIYSQLIKEIRLNKLPNLYVIIFSSLFLLLSHYIIGFIAVLIYIGTYIYIRYESFISNRISAKRLTEVGMLIITLFILFSPVIPLGFINKGEASFYTFSLARKSELMKQAYGYSLLLFLPLGILTVVNRKRKEESLILIVATLITILVLSGIPYALKFYVLGRFFIHFLIALGLASFISKIKSFNLQNWSISFLVMTLLGIFIVNSVYWKSILNYQNITTHISPNEVEAAQFLKSSYSKENILIISDPATQNILEGFSGINSPGGAYMNQSNRTQLSSVSQRLSTDEIVNRLFSINDRLEPKSGKIILALSGRYFLWQEASLENKQALYFNIWTPADLTFDNKRFIRNLLSDSAHFKLVYSNPTIYLIEVQKGSYAIQ